MKKRCSNPRCFLDSGEECALGKQHRHLAECPHWIGHQSGTTEEVPDEALTVSAARVPWSGSALGLADLANLVPRGRAIVIGVLGAHDAGKTTLLTANYLRLLRGHRLARASFAGSRTLGAWESLAAWTRFDDAARAPTFPPHTSRGIGRVPGLLHIALRGQDDAFRDVLFTDAPGEWFTRWAIAEDAHEAEGARWVVRHADAFLVLADCDRLSGPTRGQARSEVRQLLERLGNHIGARPCALVWAKHDKPPPSGIQNAIRHALNQLIPHATEAESTTKDMDTVTAALEAALVPAWVTPRARPLLEPVVNHRPFAAFRGSRAHA